MSTEMQSRCSHNPINVVISLQIQMETTIRYRTRYLPKQRNFQRYIVILSLITLFATTPPTTNAFSIIPSYIQRDLILNPSQQIRKSVTINPCLASIRSTVLHAAQPDDFDDYDDDTDDDDDNDSVATTTTTTRIPIRRQRKSAMTPISKSRSKRDGSKTTTTTTSIKSKYDEIAEANRQRAIENKKKREPVQDKKRRLLVFMKKQQVMKKRANKVVRPIALKGRNFTLSEIEPGMELNGTVISLTSFGAYVDVGTEVDGLLHISQLSRTTFIEHPRQVLETGQNITVTVRSLSIEKKKLHLSMLPADIVMAELSIDHRRNGKEIDDDDRIPLEDIQVDDELWGIIKRVTDYGGYIEVGAVVDGFLHFMDHPDFEIGTRPRDFMHPKDRVRVWVSNVDEIQNRIKLTAIRPKYLPGPRREL